MIGYNNDQTCPKTCSAGAQDGFLRVEYQLLKFICLFYSAKSSRAN